VAAVVVIAALYWAQEVLIPVALAILLTFLLAPIVHYVERRRVPRVPAVLAVVVGMFLLVGLLGWVVVGQVLDLANSIDQYRGNIVTKIERFQSKGGLISKLSKFGEDVGKDLEKPATQSATKPAEVVAQEVAQQTNDPKVVTEQSKGVVPSPATQPTKENPLPVAIVQPRPSPMESLGKYMGLVLGPLGTAGIVIVFVIFMLLSREDMRDRMIRLVGYGQMHVTTRALDDAATRISRYLTAQAIVNGTYGVAIAIGLWVIGMSLGDHPFPNVVLWGLLCAVLRFVPYIGPWVAAVFPLAVAFAVYPGFGVFAAVLGLFVVIELLSNNLMEPWLYGASTGMSTVAILVSAVFWTWLWGPMGLLLSTPMTVCLVVMGKHVPQLGFLDVMLGDEPVLAPHERVYQRLLAMDQEEAAEVAEEYLGKMSIEDVYDRVLMPALAMGENDRHRGRLDDARQDFIRDSMRDTVDEVMEQNRARQVRAAAAATEAVAKGDDVPEKAAGVESAKEDRATTTLPAGAELSVVLLPAHDPADEIAGTMVANALKVRGYRVTVVSVTALASEMVETVERERADVVIVSAMPPAAVTHSRYLCKRLHARFPDIETVVGLWMWKGDRQKAKDRITCTRTVRMVTSLCEAVEEVHQLVQPRLVQLAEERKAGGK
jgi:predicted PurR-regulated permease PerM/methylmalonyl-CoA mutase cobalamin-binding subunit